MVPVRAGSSQHNTEEECNAYSSPSRRSSATELRLDPRITTSSTSVAYDHTSAPKSMRARIERTSVTLSSTVDHPSGYITTSSRPSTARRRSAGTNVSIRHRSPRISASAPQERYMPYSATSPRSSSSLSPLSPRPSTLASAHFTSQDSLSSVASSEQRDIFWSATASAEFVSYSTAHSPTHTQTSPRHPSTTSTHHHFQSFDRVQDYGIGSAVFSHEQGDTTTLESWPDHFSRQPHHSDPSQLPTALHHNEQHHQYHQYHQSQSQDQQRPQRSSLSPLLTQRSHHSSQEILPRFDATLPSHSVLSISEDRARMSHNPKDHVIRHLEDMDAPPQSHYNQPARFQHHHHHRHAPQAQHQHSHPHQTSRHHPHSWHQEGHASELAQEQFHSSERETPYYFHHASQSNPQPIHPVSQVQYFVPPPHSNPASPHHPHHQHHPLHQHHQHHHAEQPRSRPHTRQHHPFSMGYEQMPGSEEHALTGMATVINPSVTAKPIGTVLDQPASFNVAIPSTAPIVSGTKTTRRRRRPNESYSNIIIKAIRNSPLQRLKLSDIYDYVSREIPQMNGDDKGWQNTVRHNLSHNKCFRRVVIKSAPLGSGSADEKDESKQQPTPPSPPLVLLPPSSSSSKEENNDQAQVLEYATKGKGGYWVLVPEFLEEAMSSSRPKKSLTDLGTLRQAATATTAATATITAAAAAKVSGIRPSTVVATSATSSGAGPISGDQSSSTAMDIDLDVASMAIAGRQQQQQMHRLGRFRDAEDESMTGSSGDENELESDQSDGQSVHSLLSLKSSHDSIRSSSGSEFDELEEDDDDEEEEGEHGDGDGEGTNARRAMSIQDMLN